MKNILLLLCVLISFGASAQTVYPWGSPTGKGQAKGELQTDSGIHFIPRTLGKFAGTNDSMFSLQVSIADSQLHYTKNGHTWYKVLSSLDSGRFISQGGDNFHTNDSIGPKDSARNIIFLTGSSIPMIIYGNGRVSIGTTPDEGSYLLGLGGGIRLHSGTTGGNIYADGNIMATNHFTDLGASTASDTSYKGVAVIDANDTFKYRTKSVFLQDLSYRFIADPQANIPSAITNIVDIGSNNRSKAGTFNFISGINNGGVASGTSGANFISGNNDSIMGQSATNYNHIIGSRIAFGDSTSNMLYCKFIGALTRVWSNGFTMNYYHMLGASNSIYQKGNSNIPSFMIGDNNTDSVNSTAANYGTFIFGSAWINRHKQSICIGNYGDHSATSSFTTREDYSTNIAGTGSIYFHVGGHDTTLTLKYSTGAVLINTNMDDGTNKLQVNGGISATSVNTKASADLTARSAAVASVCTYTPTATGTYRIGAYLNITAVSTNTIKTQVTYFDENGTSQTADFFSQGTTTAALSTIGNSTYPGMDIRAGTGGAIVIKTTFVATGGSMTYDVGGTITMLR